MTTIKKVILYEHIVDIACSTSVDSGACLINYIFKKMAGENRSAHSKT
jgi:hypothetical protein